MMRLKELIYESVWIDLFKLSTDIRTFENWDYLVELVKVTYDMSNITHENNL